MRLICPNCDAQYEVPDDVMPVSGRDVQCSNCGQTWFQHHPDNTPDARSSQEDMPAPDEETAPPPPPPPATSTPERKQLDPAVADILRQEAEAEQRARQTRQTDSLESQPDLGMDYEDAEDEAERRARQARDRMARLRGNDAAGAQAAGAPLSKTDTGGNAAAALGSRRDLLPNIDEINSTLRSGSGRTGHADLDPEIEAPTHQRKRRGFRTGFVSVLLIFAVLAVVYVFASRLSTTVPALAGPLATYTSAVDDGRSWLDETIQALLRRLDSAAAESDS